MKKLLHPLYSNRHFLLFILLFAYIQSIYSRISANREIDSYTFTPESALATLISVSLLFFVLLFFIRNWQGSDVYSSKKMLKVFGASLITYILVMQLLGLVIAFGFDNIERNFNRETIVLSTFSHLLNGFIYGSFFLVYYYYRQNIKKQQQLISYNKALSESKINQLKTQLNPHFLFNNLNILDQLIEEDKDKASGFLNEFAEIYRYVLQASDKKLISIKEELIFVEQYFSLIQHKYENAYQLVIENHNNNGHIVPLTLQLLIENVIQHNLGTIQNPVYIKIVADENLEVTNNYIPKQNKKAISGRGLNNLKQQYQLLANKPIEIQKSDNIFSVIIPII